MKEGNRSIETGMEFLSENLYLVTPHNRQVIEILNIAMVDDDPEMLQELSQSVNAYMHRRSVQCSVRLFASGTEFLSRMQYFDLVFLDIQMDGISGMDTARDIRIHGLAEYIVFITILSEYVYDAFDVEASDYLLKPIDYERFERMMGRICGHFQRPRKPCLRITSRGNAFRCIFFADISYCEAVNHKIQIHTKDTQIECCLKINDLGKRLDDRFFQCHRSYLVNLEHVCGYEDGLVLLKNGERIPVSRLRAREFSRKMLQYMKDTVK